MCEEKKIILECLECRTNGEVYIKTCTHQVPGKEYHGVLPFIETMGNEIGSRRNFLTKEKELNLFGGIGKNRGKWNHGKGQNKGRRGGFSNA